MIFVEPGWGIDDQTTEAMIRAVTQITASTSMDRCTIAYREETRGLHRVRW